MKKVEHYTVLHCKILFGRIRFKFKVKIGKKNFGWKINLY